MGDEASFETIMRGVESLRPHPVNHEIYRERDLGDLIESIREYGIQMPLLVSFDDRIISGHRRLAAARILGLEVVPTILSAARTETDILALLLQNNVQRVKDRSEIAKEMAEMEGVVRERAAERKAATQFGSVTRSTVPITFTEPEKGGSREIVGAVFGISGPTTGRMIAVAKGVAKLEQEGCIVNRRRRPVPAPSPRSWCRYPSPGQSES